MVKASFIRQVVFSSLLIFMMSRGVLYAQLSQVKGHIKGLANQPVVFGYLLNGSYKLDTVLASKDQFTYTPKNSDDGRIQLRISLPRYTSFWYEPGVVSISGSMDKPYRLTFRGGTENTILTQYQQAIEWPFENQTQNAADSVKALLAEQERQATVAFIEKHPTSRTSAYLLYWQTILHESFLNTYENLFTLLSPKVQVSYQGRETAQRIRVLHNQPVVGKRAPDFTLADTAGHAVSLANYRGKYVLLDFWGHWCSPCLKSFPKLKSLQLQYGDKLTIIGVAAEFVTDKPQWIRAINTHALSWPQVSELMADKGQVNTTYNITAFPTYLLLDGEGTVLERSLGLEAIEQKLATMNK